MACADECHGSAQFYGFSGILPTVCRRIFKDSRSDHGIAEEKPEVVGTEKCAEAFRRLKELLKTAPILKVPDMDADFLV